MERSVGSRLQTLFQQLEKIGGKAVRNQTSTEDLQQIRYVTSKIYQILNTQEKLHRDTVLKNPSWIDLVLLTLKNTADRSVQLNLIQVLLELAGKALGKRVGILVSANASNVLFQLIYREAEDQASCEDTVMLAHQVLAKLAQKDRKFATKARLNSVLVITLNLIKNNLYNFRNLQPLLQVFKAYTNNSVNSSYLGKHNSIPPMLRVIQQCGRKHTAVLKLALDILTNLTKSRNNAARTIGGEHVPHLLALYHDWHQIDTKHRYISLRKAILSILKNITNLRSGRKALVDANGIQVLYDSAQEVIDCREMESLILLASVIMRKCCPRNKLPLSDLRSAVSHELPLSELYPEISQQDPSFGFGGFTETQDSDNSSLEDDDDIDSDDERFKTDHMEEVEDDQVDTPEPFKRTADDLRMYDNFFPELFEIEIQDEDDGQTTDQLPTSIYIPTGNYDTYQMSTATSSTQDKTLYRMTSCISYASSKTSGYSSLQYDTQEYVDNYPPPPRCDSATAINMKTGTSVFSLDIPVSQPSKTTSTKPKTSSQQKSSSSVSKKQKGSKKTSKDKKKKSSSSLSSMGSVGTRLSDLDTEFSESLYISPYNTSSSNNLEEGGGDSTDEEDADSCHDSQLFQDLAGYTKSVYRFEKLAFPDLHGGKSLPTLEPLFHRKFGVQRVKVFEDIDRMIHPENVIDRDVFDLDSVVKHAGSSYTSHNSNLSNRDQLRIGNRLDPGGASSLKFNSQFESGNLRKAVWVRDFEYDLILNPDINTNHHHQWFYFEVSNMLADAPYRFNIVNCEKLNSQFNFGMKPVMFSVTEAVEGRPYWFRTGTDICYYRNHFTRSPQATGGVKGKTYYTATFTVTFKHNKDICYLAYHYPYTYTTLQTHLYQCERSLDHNQIFFRRQSLCQTLMGNDVPVLTITARPKSSSKDHVEELRSRPYIFLSGRVHPGESNSSWVMKGTIDFLLSKKPAAQQLRESYIFKIIPMLNPDGVINGCHRCSLAAEDLNRRWDNPCPKLHPTIYHTKGLLQYLQMINKVPMVFCDYHGHSRRKNIFIYGCSPTMSWIPNDTENPACSGNRTEDNGFKTLPRILHLLSPTFSWPNCSFIVEKAKETTARVVVWRQIGVVRSYTMESTYCGIDKDGKLKDQHISTLMLEEMGHKFCEGLLRLRSKYSGFDNLASFPAGSGTNQAEGTTTGRQRGDDLFDENLNEEEDNMELFATDDLDDETSDDDDMYQDEDEENYDEDA